MKIKCIEYTEGGDLSRGQKHDSELNEKIKNLSTVC